MTELRVMQSQEFQYVGSELAAFAKAVNWKARLRAQIAPFLRGRVAEVGAGLGAMTVTFASCPATSWLALEPDPNLAGQIPASARTRVFVGILSDLPPGETFDTIMYIDVVEHIEDDEAELETAAKHLAPGGHLVVLVPAHNFLFTPFDKAIGHFRRYDKEMLRHAAPANLMLKKLRYLDSVGFFASLANRLFLQQSAPSVSQILFWDRVLVPASKLTDPLLGYQFGKSVLGIWEKSV